MFLQKTDMLEDPLDQATCRLGIIQGNVVSDSIEIVERGFGPDYFSHLAIRCFACL